MNQNSRIYVAGHNGLVGGAIVRRLRLAGYTDIITRSRAELELLSQPAVDAFFAAERPEYVFLAAAKVGGIIANSTQPAEFIYENLALQTNVIHSAYRHGVNKLLFLGSSCIYPKHAPQPISESDLLSGPLEPTNDAYAVAKIAGLKLCQAYTAQYGFNCISLMPTNLYGPGDNFDLQTSHVLPALIRKFHDAKLSGAEEVVLWGSGTPYREFLHVDDLADACVFLMLRYDSPEIINVGSGDEVTIAELAAMVRQVTECGARIRFDTAKPDGTPRKLLNSERLAALGWRRSIALRDGLQRTYEWFLQRADPLTP